MPQDNNHLLQDSYTDLLETSTSHVYDGIFPVNVNNDNDTISLDPIAKTVIEPTNTVHVETDTNIAGNTVYKLHVSHDAGKSYEGVYPVQVNNNRNEISVNNVNLDVQWPLFGEVDNDTLTLGSKFGNYYANNESHEINNIEYWNKNNSDRFIRLFHDDNINPINFGYMLSELPPSGSSNYLFGGDHEWHEFTTPGFYVNGEYKTLTATVDTTRGYQEFLFNDVGPCNTFEADYVINTTVVGLSQVAPFAGYVETYVNDTLVDSYSFQAVNGTTDLTCDFYVKARLGYQMAVAQEVDVKVRIYNGANRWKNGSTQTLKATFRKYIS